ncbi:MAG: hypothetical protein Q8P18_33195 [Pseudomonadota bacterium]|nr:hypothetical protein [Pseudomonadota bacterium]
MALPRAQTSLTRSGSGVLYSTVQLNTADSLSNASRQFFGYGQGSVAPGMTTTSTVTETNLMQASTVGGDASFVATGLSLGFFYPGSKVSLSAADLHDCLDSSIVSWQFNQTVIQLCPAIMAGQGGGVYGVGGTNTTVAAELNNGAGGIFRFSPVVLYPNATFSLIVNWGVSAIAPSAAILMRATFVGSYQNALAAG